MKNLMRNGQGTLFTSVMLGSMVLLFAPAIVSAASPAVPGGPPEMLRSGERIYREGILPSGERLRVTVKGDTAVPGMTFACVSCHLRSGLGAVDEGVNTLSINGDKLFKPLRRRYKGIEQSTNASLPPLRPAYTEESLVKAIRSGVDPNGRVLSDVMPRYPLEDGDAKVLVAYLRALSAEFSPGVSDTTIRFATVVSEDARPELRDAMLASINSYFTIKNNQIRAFNNPQGIRSRLMAERMLGSKELAAKNISLATWVVKGPPETWRSQLEEYDRKEPVFAIVGGITNGEWQPIHQFSEDNRIPCLFPITDLPVVSGTDWYTLYLSKGFYQEGESAARYLNSREGALKGRPVVQVVRAAREAEALSRGFQHTWQDLGQPAPVMIPLPAGKSLDKDLLQQILTKHKPAALVIWDDAAALPALELLSRREDRPEMVFLSGRYLGDRIWTLKEREREFTYLTYPYSFSPYVPNIGMTVSKAKEDPKKTLKRTEVPIKDEVQRVVSVTNAMTPLLAALLMDLQGNYYRDNLLDVAGMMADQPFPLYGQLSFSTGQRYASRGCYIVQLSPGDEPELVRQSGWMTE